MLRVVVATDLSPKTSAGPRFAIQWSQQQKMKLTFFHLFHPIRMPQWTQAEYDEYVLREQAIKKAELTKYILDLHKVMKLTPGKYTFVVQQGISPDIAIMDFCRLEGNVDFICSATHGAGRFEKIFGTRTGNLITKSDIPVIAVPEQYKRKSIRKITYATDFTCYESELKKVETIAKGLNAAVEVIHLETPYEVLPDQETLTGSTNMKLPFDLNVEVKRADPHQSFFRDLKLELEKTNPSLVVMFTEHHKNIMDRILFPSKAERLSFDLPFPLLVFPRES